jgi:hypothetical protein
MSSASPDDLAITFRSVPRRLREAQGESSADEFARLSGGLNGLISEAGRLLGATNEPGRIADAIAAIRADDWESATLTRLRDIALEIGQQLRQIAAAGER